ncbi:hypothetical protein LOZ12_004869 [Ophidiomyces ophidiicola]|uniref:Uncharacterized protein n=1 Tax=Ophidiomyces ophidiicola TaxID=1387563 RepID=A0ACB8UUU3_9EURO|nr:hypothetical protein LOZ61_005700 [Ophidiomyces ophidiicola]KAI1926458.1 hypothetical protein LOZ64_000221 [Ophidiomyces ophidiicola]KAI1940251.1 hypothetical protein LOZ62_004937 [Ophidiomyces ophidiicola]KAI1969021.1 hypothetical protein LOZ59_000045 [Ophidiomyces ophidiicola]KAI1970896.1 hypothetical protein LOZ56_003415 [Ophidiomyces ophidiicola]
MAKHKRVNKRGSQVGKTRHYGTENCGRRMRSFARVSTNDKPKQAPKKKDQKKNGQRNQQAVIPFLSSDRILLVGEGDFSFAQSLTKGYGCRRILATCYDSEDVLYQKYPQAKEHINNIRDSSNQPKGSKRKRGNESASEGSDNESSDSPHHTKPTDMTSPKVLFSIDARKLGLAGGGGRVVRKGFPRNSSEKYRKKENLSSGKEQSDGPWDIICFNFPHVGGLSTDVNRQVRANQELLVSFFKACGPLLSAPLTSDSLRDEDEESGDFSSTSNRENSTRYSRKLRAEPGQIVVTLFEGEPYTLWNIRDLARHAGLRVVTSFKFPWASYAGYSHARTLGEIEGKDGQRGGWRGEEREARSYVFEPVGFESRNFMKRKAESESEDD